MCGIVGYIGPRDAAPILFDGLERLEYRGYDSAGLAVVDERQNLVVLRAPGKLHNLRELIGVESIGGVYGIGHTRWATHGRPTQDNAHPHRDCHGELVVVHNGIVENYLALKEQLRAEGHIIRTETDSEVIAHLIENHFTGDLEEAVRRAVRHLKGVFALGVISRADPNKIVAARSGPPAVIGVGDGEYFLASDIPAILSHTRDVLFLDDGEMAVLTPEGVRLSDFAGRSLSRKPSRIAWDPGLSQKNGFPHFMLKEIFEQPISVRDTAIGRIDAASGQVHLDDMEITSEEFANCKQVRIVACGTSWHAALVGKTLIETLARIPVEVDYGSEFRYRDPIVLPDTITVVISQSGETADTLAAQREAKAKGSKSLAIANVVGSMITRAAAGSVLTHAGPEIGVASTKAFTAQLTALVLLAMFLGQKKGTLSKGESRRLAVALGQIPSKLETILGSSKSIDELARKFSNATDFLFLGRGIHFPIALEGALKLKEISYIHAEGYPAGEMKHGPNALIDDTLPVVILATRDRQSEASCVRYEKTLSNIQEVKARGGIVLAIVCEGDEAEVSQLADYLI
jgi:glutamine---fructose-6-phosphate transaminase (isomerizing)